MEEFDRIDNSYILVEFAGARKWILKEKLSAAEDMAAHMRKWAAIAGNPQSEIEELYTLRIVKEKT